MTDYAKSLEKLKTSALGAAMTRAFAAQEPDAGIRNGDSLAREFLDPAARPPKNDPDKIAAFREQLEGVLPGAYHFQNARTKHIDTRLEKALADGFRQVVMLGAGFDTRAYRFGESAPDVRFFEVDLPELQAEKKAKITEIFGSLPANVVYMPLDFNKEPLSRLLDAPGFDRSRPTFFNWEGVSYYLTAEGVEATLAFVANQCAADSKILFDYMPSAMVEGTGAYYGGAESRAYMAKFGEPLLFGIEDDAIDDFLQARGFRLESCFGPDDLENAYLITGEGERYGRVSGYVRIAEARVL